VEEFTQSKYFIPIFLVLFLFYTRFRIRNKPYQKMIIDILLKINLALGGFLSYFLQDYTLGLILHGLFLCDLILFGNGKTIIIKFIRLFTRN
jgi:hypothetical protein